MSSLVSLMLGVALLAPSVEIHCESSGVWRFEQSAREVEPGVQVVTIRARTETPSVPPVFSAVISFPQLDVTGVWEPNFNTSGDLTSLPWWGTVFNVARTQPLRCWFGPGDCNRLMLAAGELRRTVKLDSGIKEEDFRYYTHLTYFTEATEPMTSYETEIRLDAREVDFVTAVREAASWQAMKAGGSPAAVPEAGYEPVYSTWYNFHKDVTAPAVESELELAAGLGMKTVILDDGWQCDDIERSYKSCGDWRISPRRFPDMAGHVRKAHGLGLKYMVWFSMPFVGEKTEAYARLQGKFLRKAGGLEAWVIDPRFPECRAYLKEVYLRCLREWDIDGFKLDFVDAFGLEGEDDPAMAENFAGRDTPSIPEGVERLLSEVTAALTAEKPDLLFEFRQAYVGPVIRRYGNLMRVGDCPGSLVRNRVHIANLRLLCDGSAVHSDMLRWHPDETPERAQRFILNSLFGAVQYSVMLRETSPEMRAMIAKWIAFQRAHRETLLKGTFRPHFPHLGYPVIEAESESERIVVLYDPAVPFVLGPIVKRTIVIDATSGAITEHHPERTPSFAAFDARAHAGENLTVASAVERSDGTSVPLESLDHARGGQ